MANLTNEAKEEIVLALARYEKPAAIARRIKEAHGLTKGSITTSQMSLLNPSLPSYRGGERFIQMFDAERERWCKEVKSHPIAYTGYRLGILQRMALDAEYRGDFGMAAKLLEQAARDVGGIFTNERFIGLEETRKPPMTAAEARANLKKLLESIQRTNPPAAQQVIEDNPNLDTRRNSPTAR